MEPPRSRLSAELLLLWHSFGTLFAERLQLLAAAATAVQAGTLTLTAREAAEEAAHKLAGGLGTFGLANGSTQARLAERLLTSDQPLDTTASAQLTEIVATLAAIIAAGPTAE